MIYIPRYVNGLLFYTAYWLVSSRYMFSKYLFIPGIVGGILWISYTTLKEFQRVRLAINDLVAQAWIILFAVTLIAVALIISQLLALQQVFSQYTNLIILSVFAIFNYLFTSMITLIIIFKFAEKSDTYRLIQDALIPRSLAPAAAYQSCGYISPIPSRNRDNPVYPSLASSPRNESPSARELVTFQRTVNPVAQLFEDRTSITQSTPILQVRRNNLFSDRETLCVDDVVAGYTSINNAETASALTEINSDLQDQRGVAHAAKGIHEAISKNLLQEVTDKIVTKSTYSDIKETLLEIGKLNSCRGACNTASCNSSNTKTSAKVNDAVCNIHPKHSSTGTEIQMNVNPHLASPSKAAEICPDELISDEFVRDLDLTDQSNDCLLPRHAGTKLSGRITTRKISPDSKSKQA